MEELSIIHVGVCLGGGVGGEGGEWLRGLGVGFTNHVVTVGELKSWRVGCVLLRWCPGICVLCLADTCASEVYTVFNHVAPNA